MRLQTGDDADRALALAAQRVDGRGDGAGGDAGDLAEEPTAIEARGAPPLGDVVSTTCRCGTGARRVVSSPCVQIARHVAWQLGQTEAFSWRNWCRWRIRTTNLSFAMLIS